ncbi:MAG TPA: hypothetical protein VMU45_15340 [Candidatus Eisenbacteria bacterium]|nr:hypothetical protein [Candidatus Eisenbacteria bacterium]
MQAKRTSTLVMSLAAMFFSLLLIPSVVHADSVPSWMTGDFYGDAPYDVLWFSPDSEWAVGLSVNAIEHITDSWSSCSEQIYYCEYWDLGDYLGGTVDGELRHWNGTDFIVEQTFNGQVEPGGQITKVLADYGNFQSWSYEYFYSFKGQWSNQWHTDGSVYGWDEGNTITGQFLGSWFSVTTTTPEPRTIVTLFSSALAVGAYVRRKRNW